MSRRATSVMSQCLQRIQRPERQSRSAFSLIEMQAVIAILGTVMVIATGLYHHALQSDLRSQQTYQEMNNWTRLGEQLREDVARTASLDVRLIDERNLILVCASGQGSTSNINYQVGPKGITRQIEQDGLEAASSEYYQLAASDERLISTWKWIHNSQYIELVISLSDDNKTTDSFAADRSRNLILPVGNWVIPEQGIATSRPLDTGEANE